MYKTSLFAVAALAAAAFLTACSGQSRAPEGGIADAGDPADPGTASIPGTASLSAGARLAPDRDAEVPLPKVAAQAGVDFASNRFVVIYENNPAPAALASYLDGDPPGSGSDIIRARDNAGLVNHPYLRKVSHNLATHYQLGESNRVFYKDVNFSVFEAPQVGSVTDLDALMLKVLHENSGLVREVCYDFYLHVDGPAASPAPDPAENIRAGQRRHPVHSAAQEATPAETAVRRSSSAPDYNNPDPYYLNQQGFDTDLADGADDSGQWPLFRIGATLNEAWSYTTGSSSTVVAVIDTGARYTHEDLTDNVVDPLNDAPYNAPGILTDLVNKDNDPWDGHGHGTFCAGEIAAKANNGKGVAGICWNCTLIPIKVVNDSGSASDANVAEGMLLADSLGANIASMSLGSYFSDRLTQLSAKQCNADGMLVICGSGNYNSNAPFYPAYYPECMAVGATTLVNSGNNEDFSNSGGSLPIASRYDAKVNFSCFGPWVDIASPGHRCLCTTIAGDSAYIANWSGTSMATPYVAGCAALLWSYISSPTNDKVRGLLQSGATTMDHLCNSSNPKGFIDNSSNGTVHFVNAFKSLQLYESGMGNAPGLSWDNPANGATLSGVHELRVSASGGSGTVSKVEFETFGRLIGTQTSPSGGFYRQNWDSSFEFNRPIELRAKAYDDKGNITAASITVTPNNTRKTPSWTENFDSLSNNSVPAEWFTLDGNTGSGNTNWGADSSTFVSGTKSLHSSGTSANWGAYSNDYLYAPVIDLKNYAKASLSFQRRYQTPSGEDAFLLATTDDKNYSTVSFGSTSLVDWGNYTYDLSNYAGQEVRLLWAIVDIQGNLAPGIWIDDINLSAAAGTPPTIAVNSPSAGASVSGLVPINLTVSDDTVWVSLYAEPPDISGRFYSPIPDNDPVNPTKTYTINWDSRHTYNGAALLNLYAWDDEDNDGSADDFSARASLPVSVTNSLRNPDAFDGFENITTLGGFNASALDGDWYVWQFGANTWRVTSDAGQFRTGAQGCKFGPAGNGNYSPNDFALLYGPVHDISGSLRPYLRYWQKLDVENGNGDIAKVYLVQYDGTEDVRIPISELRSDTSPAGQWQEVDVNLARWKPDRLRFNFIFRSDADSGAGNVGAGWFIDDYEVLDANPSISSLSPARGQVGSSVTINGSNFGMVQGTSTVSFAKTGGGRTTATVTSWSNTQIQVTVPANAQTGTVIVNLLGYDSNAPTYKVILAPPNLGGLGQL